MTTASASVAVARTAPVQVLGRAALRVPLLPQALPIAGAFLCSYLLYGRIAGGAAVLGWHLLEGIASLVVLFAVLRLVDDLDDVGRDHPAWSPARRTALRLALGAALAACIALLAFLNYGKWQATTAAALAVMAAFAAPFGFKRRFPDRVATGFLVFEAAPFLVFAYCHLFWRDATGSSVPAETVVCVAGLFWAGYEFWKFSRKAHADAMQPYFLGPWGIRAALHGFLAVMLAANLGLVRLAGLSEAYATFALALTLVWLVWMNLAWPAAPGERRPGWAGMSLVVALELGLFAELLLSTPGSR